MTVTKKDIFKHYGASVLVYGFILLFISCCPFFTGGIDTDGFNYIHFFAVYYALYVVLAPLILIKVKPETVKTSRNIAVLAYIKRQFTRGLSLEERIKNIEPDSEEKQAFVILFMQTFFGVFAINLICNKFIPSMDYNIDFLKEMFSQAVQYAQMSGITAGILQYLDDTNDMWMTLMLGLITLIFGISTLTEMSFLKNRIKKADTTPLGILSCIMCYYPLKSITDSIIPIDSSEPLSVDNLPLRITLDVIMLAAQFIILLSVLRLGTKSGNLTNRGIVTKFPYNIVRHPDYAMQMILLISITIPEFLSSDFYSAEKILIFAGLIGWALLYYARAVTEERNLMEDADYKQYAQKVKYRFIPKLF